MRHRGPPGHTWPFSAYSLVGGLPCSCPISDSPPKLVRRSWTHVLLELAGASVETQLRGLQPRAKPPKCAGGRVVLSRMDTSWPPDWRSSGSDLSWQLRVLRVELTRFGETIRLDMSRIAVGSQHIQILTTMLPDVTILGPICPFPIITTTWYHF